MASYLLQISYTTSAWAALTKKPENRVDAVGKVVEKLGGKLTNFWFAFGDHDLIGVVDMPDHVAAAAFSMAISSGGACKNVKTTPLMSVADGMEAMKKAGSSGYKPVGANK